MQALWIGLLTLSSWLCIGLAFSAPASPLTFQSESDLRKVRPSHDTVRIAIKAQSAEAEHFEKLHVKLLAPPSRAWISTDFPVVEGTVLFDAAVPLEKGAFDLSFVPPIRGAYRLEATPLAADGRAAATETWSFTIKEDAARVRNLSVFLLILALISAICGYAIGASERKKAQLLLQALALMLLLGSAPHSASAHGSHAAPTAPVPRETLANSSEGLKLDLRLATEQPRVGQLTEITGSLVDAAQQPVPARFQLSFTQIEHGLRVVSTELVSHEGTFRVQSQLYDGSPHKLEVTATPIDASSAPVQSSLLVDVEAVSPPPLAIGKSFSLLLVFAALSMLAGFYWGRYRKAWVAP